jgi:hypothetical protein
MTRTGVTWGRPTNGRGGRHGPQLAGRGTISRGPAPGGRSDPRGGRRAHCCDQPRPAPSLCRRANGPANDTPAKPGKRWSTEATPRTSAQVTTWRKPARTLLICWFRVRVPGAPPKPSYRVRKVPLDCGNARFRCTLLAAYLCGCVRPGAGSCGWLCRAAQRGGTARGVASGTRRPWRGR